MNILMILLLLFACIGLPVLYAVRIWRLDVPARAAWLLILADAFVIGLLVLIVGRWDMAGIHTHWVLAAIFALAALRSWRHHHARPWRGNGQPLFRGYRSSLLSLMALAAVLAWVASGLFARHDPVMLAFPLTGGKFTVAQGGDNFLLNNHHSHRAQRHALDITAVNAFGIRAAGLLPGDLSRYVIFGKTVVSPCNGVVIEQRDGLPDLKPPRADRENPAGNHVVIACGDLEVTLAHFRKGSVQVRNGASVARGDIIGRVGNSGNTSEPHLHIHAVDSKTGKSVQIGFDGRVPARNSIFRR